MRKYMIAGLMLISTPALADPPKALLLPTSIIVAIRQYLMQRPYAEVFNLVAAIEGCSRVQVPNDQGVTISTGECRDVTDTLDAQAAALAAAKKAAADKKPGP